MIQVLTTPPMSYHQSTRIICRKASVQLSWLTLVIGSWLSYAEKVIYDNKRSCRYHQESRNWGETTSSIAAYLVAILMQQVGSHQTHAHQFD